MSDLEESFIAVTDDIPTSGLSRMLRLLAKQYIESGDEFAVSSLHYSADRLDALEAEADWLAMKLGINAVPGSKPMAKKRETGARYWRDAARDATRKEATK